MRDVILSEESCSLHATLYERMSHVTCRSVPFETHLQPDSEELICPGARVACSQVRIREYVLFQSLDARMLCFKIWIRLASW